MIRKKYLVTGGTGFLGRALVRALVEAGAEVRVFDNDSRGSAKTLADLKEKIEFVAGDIRDLEAVKRAAAKVDSICHLAYINGTKYFYEQPDLVLDVGVKGMTNVLDAAKANLVPELFLMSSSEVYQTPPSVPTNENVPLVVPDPLNPRYSYGGGKIISELLAINYGRKLFERTLIVRPHNVFGPNMGKEHVVPEFALRMRELAKGKPPGATVQFPIQGDGSETRAFVYIDDFTDGVMTILRKGENLNIYHIGRDEETSIGDVAKTVGLYFDLKAELIPGSLTKGSTLRRCPDISKARALGYQPKISLKDGIFKTVEWYHQNG